MLVTLASGLIAAAFTTYPGFGDAKPRVLNPVPKVEVVTDRGPILEMVIKCPQGTAIISYSKVERLYCGPRSKCNRNGAQVARAACGF